jgi:hypothetical protein
VRKIKEKYMTEHQETKAARILKEKEERETAQEARTKVARERGSDLNRG